MEILICIAPILIIVLLVIWVRQSAGEAQKDVDAIAQAMWDDFHSGKNQD